MDGTRLAARRPMLALALAPGLAVAQGARPEPPGAVSGAWPLGLIVALVALVMLAGVLVDRRRRRGGHQGPQTP